MPPTTRLYSNVLSCRRPRFRFKVASPSFRPLSLRGPRRPLSAVMALCTAQLDVGRSPGVNYHPPCLIFTNLFYFFSLFLTHCSLCLHGCSSDKTWQHTSTHLLLGFTNLSHLIDPPYALHCLCDS